MTECVVEAMSESLRMNSISTHLHLKWAMDDVAAKAGLQGVRGLWPVVAEAASIRSWPHLWR